MSKQPIAPGPQRRAECNDAVKYLRRRADEFREEGNPTLRLIIRDLADELQRGRHRK